MKRLADFLEREAGSILVCLLLALTGLVVFALVDKQFGRDIWLVTSGGLLNAMKGLRKRDEKKPEEAASQRQP